MIKKAALIVFTFSALVGAHLVYVQAFALVADRLALGDEDAVYIDTESTSKARSNQLARDHFGAGHWSTQAVKISYYDQSRGSYMYAQDYELKNEGKSMVVTPFAAIILSKDGRTHKTVTADRAIIDMNQPYGLIKKASEPQRVTHAQLIGNVRIRDDKGTPEDRGDDMLIGPMSHIEYDEKTLQITTRSDVVIQDQEMMITGTEMMIQLRPKARAAADSRAGAGGGGFGGGFEAKTAFLYKNVHIHSNNVGSGGVLMGQSKPDGKGQTPLDLRCAGQMRIDMPEPAVENIVGPPNPYREPEPTYARFEKNVKVVRGVDQLDQLNSDMLFLTLRPDTKQPKLVVVEGADAAPATPAVAAAPADGSKEATAEGKKSLSGLKLRTALAQGHAVWVQSQAQGLVARCTELRYEKLLDQGKPDKTYLNGGTSRKLWVEKVDRVAEGPNAGAIKSIMELVAFDATILDSGPGSNSEILARGPGKILDRPNRGASPEREGWFEDQLKVVNFRQPVPPGAVAASASTLRQVTLTGPATKLVDHKQKATLEAEEKIVAEFESTPVPPATPGGKAGDGQTRIKWLRAYNNVHMTTVGRTLTAWKKLEAIFVEPAPTAKPAAPVALAAGPAPAAVAPPAQPMAAPGTIVAANEGGEPPLPESKPEEPPAREEPAVDGRANYVLAHIIPGAGKDGKSEVRDATLRGGVIVHQDPAPGEAFGKDAKGEALDLYSLGKGLMRFVVAAEDPQAANPDARGRLAADIRSARAQFQSQSQATAKLAARSRSAAAPRGFAQVEFDGKIVTSRHLIGLDQRENFAWCVGEGSMEQVADRGLLDDRGLDSDRSKPKPKTKGEPGPTPRDRMTITWNAEMRFFGRSRDKADREVAKAEFRGPSELMNTGEGKREFRRGVEAKMTDAAIYADTMDVFLDKPVDLSKASKAAPGAPRPDAAAKQPKEPQAEIAMIEAWGDDAYRPDNDQPYAGVDVTSRKYYPGTKVLKEKQRIQHTHIIYDKRTGDFEGSGAGEAYLYQSQLKAPAVAAVAARAAGPPPTVKLTQIRFSELVKGRFGVARDSVEAGPRTAEFVGNVQAADAVVANEWSGLNFDRLDNWRDHVFLTSDVLRVRTESLPAGSSTPSRSTLYAQGNAAAKTVDRSIQGDRITYDSTDQKMFVYADDGKGVSLVEQRSPGQPPNTSRGSGAMYNNLTKQFDWKDPQFIQMHDLKTGARPRALYPDLGGSGKKLDPLKPMRIPIPKTQRSSPERKGFASGQ